MTSRRASFRTRTALSYFELGDFNPAKIHITVPVGFRRNSQTPKAVALHRETLAPSEITVLRGMRICRPARALCDVVIKFRRAGRMPACCQGRQPPGADPRKRNQGGEGESKVCGRRPETISMNHYKTPAALRRALEDRLMALVGKEGGDQRYRRQAAFDRLLCRLFQDDALRGC